MSARVRSGFSLVEVLVVIAIIAVLMGLMLPAVMNAIVRAEETSNATELHQLNVAVESFKNDLANHGSYFVSQLRLCGSEAAYGNSPLDIRSKKILRQMFPRLPQNWTGMDWNGDGVPDGDATLDGAQCLVFLLAGPGGQGFSTNPTAAGGERRPPFQFDARRLQASPDGFPRYLDRYGSPYLFFSANNKPNGYQAGDCPQLPGGPYQIAPGKFANPGSFQIISAGRDRQFGAGSQLGALPPAALDNLTNFHRGTLQSY